MSDFALWKNYDTGDGNNFWEAKFQTKEGEKILKGRP